MRARMPMWSKTTPGNLLVIPTTVAEHHVPVLMMPARSLRRACTSNQPIARCRFRQLCSDLVVGDAERVRPLHHQLERRPAECYRSRRPARFWERYLGDSRTWRPTTSCEGSLTAARRT